MLPKPFEKKFISSTSIVERSIFEPFSELYASYQVNGTKYLKNRKNIDNNLQQQLDACAGEIFLSCIPEYVKAEQIAEIAATLGEIYVLRFKVKFTGTSRGFAFLQYMNPNLKKLAIVTLPNLFYKHSLRMIRVSESRNNCTLLLKRTQQLSPERVYLKLKELLNFNKLVCREVLPTHFEYYIQFNCNEEAVHARRTLMHDITKFGKNAQILWDYSACSISS